MKKIMVFMAFVSIAIWLSSCAPTASVTSAGGPSISQAQAEPYNGPKVRLAVGQFQDKTAQGGGSAYWLGNFGVTWKQIGEGTRDMLTTALFNTNRYIVLEREQLDEVLKEQDLGESGRIKKGTEAPTGEIYGADLLIIAAVTEFSGSTKGVKGGTEILRVRVGGGLGKGHIAIDIRIIDVKTSQIVASTSVEGNISSIGLEGSTEIGSSLPVSLSGFNKTPIEKAIRVCIRKAVEYIVGQTPREYYRYNK